MKKRCITWIVSALVVLSASGAFVYISSDPASALTSGDYECDLVSSGTQVKITAYSGTETNVMVPSTIDGLPVVYIGDSVFYNGSGSSTIESVTIPEGVVSIGNYAFHLCTSLSSVSIPSSVTSIGKGAFTTCTSLTSVTLPSGITQIQNLMFEKCASLTSINIPSGVTTIGEDAFLDSGLTSVSIPGSVTTIGKGAFSGCSLTSVSIPGSVTNLGTSAFSRCSALRTVTVGQGVTAVGDYVFQSCNALTSITIPNNVKGIGSNAFYGCSSLRTVTFGNGLVTIGDNAFRSCIALKNVTIPNSVNSIGENAFYYCTGLSAATIGSKVTTIGAYAFEWCNQLTSITFLGNIAPMSVGADWVHGTSENVRGHADEASNFPDPGSVFYGLTMGNVLFDSSNTGGSSTNTTGGTDTSSGNTTNNGTNPSDGAVAGGVDLPGLLPIVGIVAVIAVAVVVLWRRGLLPGGKKPEEEEVIVASQFIAPPAGSVDVFISHAEEDYGYAADIAEGLGKLGYTAWLYERDSTPGPSYLVQTGDAISRSRGFILIISKDSLSSKQVECEVERAHEESKPFIPLRVGISHNEFQARRPLWKQAIGTATSIEIRSGQTDLAIPRLAKGLKNLGILPSSEAGK